jgi:hypothetical protein
VSVPEPQSSQEHFLYLSIIMLVPAILVIGGFAAWLVFAFDGRTFPDEAKQIVIASLAFIFGGGVAATVKK